VKNSLHESQAVEPIVELSSRGIASLASRAAIELDDLRFWKEEREHRRPLRFDYIRRLAVALLEVACECPGDDVGYHLHRNGVRVITGMDDRKKAWSWLTEIMLALKGVTQDTDIDVAMDLRDTCIQFSKRSSPYEGPVIRY
jgi:hypothetical protein